MSRRTSFFRRNSLVSSVQYRASIPDIGNLVLQESGKEQHLFFGPYDPISGKRPLHLARTVKFNNTSVWLSSQEMRRGDVNPEEQGYRKRFSAAAGLLSKKMIDAATGASRAVHNNCFCDGCGMDPIVGNLWTCYSCRNYNLCDTCYTKGIHGFESSQLLVSLQEDTIIKSMASRCKSISEASFAFLLRRVCKRQKDKFNFLAEWIVQVENGEKLSRIRTRGIEIPRLEPSTRQELVDFLMPALSNRADVDVNMEWFVTASISSNQDSEDSPEKETLRIWVADKKGNTKSPFPVHDAKTLVSPRHFIS